MKRAPIALLTDFGMSDSYVAQMKGVILNIHSRATIVDITHNIEPQNIQQAAFLLAECYTYFPEGTIFVAVVDPGVGTARRAVAVQAHRRFFIGPDNGLFSQIFQAHDHFKVRELNQSRFHRVTTPSQTFHGRDIFASTAAYLSKASVFKRLGRVVPKTKLVRISQPSVKKRKNRIEGEILFFDHFGNAITNIQRHCLTQKQWITSKIWIKQKKFGGLCTAYGKTKKKWAALINSGGWLEIAVPNGSVKNSGKLKTGDSVTVKLLKSH